MADPFLGQITLFAGNFAPRGWGLCDGQLLSISQNSALFSLLGTMYGGDGRTTFGLPELRGRVPIHVGQGAGLSNRQQGQRSGQENVVLTTNNLPTHAHTVVASGDAASTNNPTGKTFADADVALYNGGGGLVGSSTATGTAGSSQQHNNLQPFLGINYIICLQGIFPSRS